MAALLGVVVLWFPRQGLSVTEPAPAHNLSCRPAESASCLNLTADCSWQAPNWFLDIPETGEPIGYWRAWLPKSARMNYTAHSSLLCPTDSQRCLSFQHDVLGNDMSWTVSLRPLALSEIRLWTVNKSESENSSTEIQWSNVSVPIPLVTEAFQIVITVAPTDSQNEGFVYLREISLSRQTNCPFEVTSASPLVTAWTSAWSWWTSTSTARSEHRTTAASDRSSPGVGTAELSDAKTDVTVLGIGGVPEPDRSYVTVLVVAVTVSVIASVALTVLILNRRRIGGSCLKGSHNDHSSSKSDTRLGDRAGPQTTDGALGGTYLTPTPSASERTTPTGVDAAAEYATIEARPYSLLNDEVSPVYSTLVPAGESSVITDNPEGTNASAHQYDIITGNPEGTNPSAHQYDIITGNPEGTNPSTHQYDIIRGNPEGTNPSTHQYNITGNPEGTNPSTHQYDIIKENNETSKEPYNNKLYFFLKPKQTESTG